MKINIFILLALCTTSAVAQQSCQRCAEFVGNAYIRLNPIYEFYYGDLESYVAENAEQFAEGSETVRCARLLSNLLLNESIRTYDPRIQRERQELDARLAGAGISTGDHTPTASEMFYNMALQLERLARVAPALARGDSGPLKTPTTELENMQFLATMILKEYMKSPMVADLLRQHEADIKRLAEIDFQIVIDHLNNVQIQSTSHTMINQQAGSMDIVLQPVCVSMITQDVSMLENAYNTNQLPQGEIDSLVRAYITEVLNEFRKSPSWRSASFGESDYAKLRSNFFHKIVTVEISSVPVGATVKLKEPLTEIGTTSISKPFQTHVKYVFVFELDGFPATETQFMVAGYPRKQKLQVKLASGN